MLVRPGTALLLSGLALALVPASYVAQIGRVGRIAKRAAINETRANVERLIREGIRCVFDDLACVNRAKADGKPVVLTDDQGELLLDDDGKPITDPAQASAAAAAANVKPGTGAWANYDFVPGDRVLFAEDFTDDTVGDFPRRLELKRGNWDVVDWQGRRLLRNTGPRGAAVEITLPEALPERFTIELDAYLARSTFQLAIATRSPDRPLNSLGANYFKVGRSATGVAFGGGRGQGVESLSDREDGLTKALTPIRIMVDGHYAKVYVRERRVANIPNAQFPRSRVIHIQNTYSASEADPILIGSIRIAAGGRDLYDALEADGRVATRGIYFATDSDRLRPESTPTLKAIGDMLTAHADLVLTIEGHTDDQGADAYNQQLSERRAAAVKAYLVEAFRIDPARLETVGFGETHPAAPNTTPEGRQQNRRVELVKRGG
jgi:OmpA-OmpF porin, OOP family